MAIDFSHFSMVGYAVATDSAPAMSASVRPYLRQCDLLPLSPGDLICKVKDPSGGELYIGVKTSGSGQSLETLNPAFDGESRVPVEIEAEVSDPEWKPFEISVSARFAGDVAPIVFELADPEQAALVKPGAKVVAEIAAFSFDLKVYPDEGAYLRAQPEGEVKFASNFFIATGTFDADVGGNAVDGRPTPYADFAGTVLKAELRTNRTGSGRFWWVLVRGYDDATFDVLIDPRQVDTPPRPGNIVSGHFWLSARLTPAG